MAFPALACTKYANKTSVNMAMSKCDARPAALHSQQRFMADAHSCFALGQTTKLARARTHAKFVQLQPKVRQIKRGGVGGMGVGQRQPGPTNDDEQ